MTKRSQFDLPKMNDIWFESQILHVNIKSTVNFPTALCKGHVEVRDCLTGIGCL